MQLDHIEGEQSRIQEYEETLVDLESLSEKLLEKSALFQEKGDEFQAAM